MFSRAVENIRGQHGVVRNALQCDAMISENVIIVFEILSDFMFIGTLE